MFRNPACVVIFASYYIIIQQSDMSNIADALKLFFGEYVVALAILIVAGGWLVWWIATTIQRMKSDVAQTRDLPCVEHKEAIGRHSDSIASTNATLARISGNLDSHSCVISKHTDKISDVVSTLARIEGQLHILVGAYTCRPAIAIENMLSSDSPQVVRKNSPKSLNNNGKTIERLFGCKEFLADNAEWLIAQVDKFAPKTPLDVEMYSLAALRIAAIDERFNGLKNKIFHSPEVILETKNGEVSYEVGLDDVLYVLSIPLRDRYLATHPELL